jgi:glycosyltransferase involved in cell wall biosynthesis
MAVALIPAHNEADLIGETVTALRTLQNIACLLVVDDGSTDATAQRATDAGAQVVRLERNAGKGAALARGVAELKALDLLNHPLLLLDADLGATATEARRLLAPVCAHEADMTVGRFPVATHKGGFGFVKRLAQRAIRELGDGFEAQAPLSGQRCLSPRCLAMCLPFAEGYGVEVALTVRALRGGCRLLEVPVEMRHRASGRDLPGILHRLRQYRDLQRTLGTLR